MKRLLLHIALLMCVSVTYGQVKGRYRDAVESDTIRPFISSHTLVIGDTADVRGHMTFFDGVNTRITISAQEITPNSSSGIEFKHRYLGLLEKWVIGPGVGGLPYDQFHFLTPSGADALYYDTGGEVVVNTGDLSVPHGGFTVGLGSFSVANNGDVFGSSVTMVDYVISGTYFGADSIAAPTPQIGRALLYVGANFSPYWVKPNGTTIRLDSVWASGTGGLTSLNGLSGTTQTFAVGTSGTDFTISSSGTIHTFNIPTASASNRGLLSTSDWATFNGKQPAGTYLIPSDSIRIRNYSTTLYQPIGTYLIPGDSTSIRAYSNSIYALQTTTLAIAGTANQITSSAGAQTLGANRTWTLSLPSVLIAPGSVGTNGITPDSNLTALGIHSTRGLLVDSNATFKRRLSLTNSSLVPTFMDTTAGKDSSMFNSYPPNRWGLYQGTAASPVTIGGPTFKIVRRQSIDSTVTSNKADPSPNAALEVQNFANKNNYTQSLGIYGAATSISNRAPGNDAAGVAGYGAVNGSGTGIGIGGFFDGRRDTAAGMANAMQLSVSDWTHRNNPAYSPSGFDSTGVLWISNHGTPGRIIASGIKFGNADGIPMAYGIGFGSMLSGAVTIADIVTDDTAGTSLLIRGSHRTAAIAVGLGSGSMVIGGTSPTGKFHIIGSSTYDSDKLLNVSGSTSGTVMVQIGPTMATTSTGQLTGINYVPVFNPSGASLGTVIGLVNAPTLNNTSLNTSNVWGASLGYSLGASYSGTVTNGKTLVIANPTISGGSVTTNTGIVVTDQTSGSTNVGLSLLVTAGANKWNIYESGGAKSYHSGNFGFGNAVTSPDSSVTALGIHSTRGLLVDGISNLATVVATSYNKLTLTTPATGSTITVADGKTLTVSNTIIFTATDGSTLAIGAGGTLGSNAYTSTAYAPLASPTFTGTVTIPTPFTLGSTSVTSTGTQLNYLNAATGTTGTASTNVVFSTSPTLITPTLGVATATTINKLTLTQPASGSTLTIVDGKTLTVNNTLILSGTDGSTLNVGAGGTLGSNAYTSTAYAPLVSPTFTGTVTVPTPFTVGATSVTSTGTQLNYLNAATGTTGTTSTSIVFSTSPTLVTPTLGVATATTINKLTLTQPASGSTLTLVDGKTFTANNTLTLSGTDGSTLNIGAGGTLGPNAYTSTAYAPLASPTFTGTVTHPTPFTLGATSVTSTGTQLNYLNAATGTTGTASTNLVFSDSPTFTGTDEHTKSRYTITTTGSGSADGVLMENTTVTTSSGQNSSPVLHLRGHVWNSTVTAADNYADYFIKVGASSGPTPSADLTIGSYIGTSSSGATNTGLTLSRVSGGSMSLTMNGYISAAVGFRINNTATSGTILRADGTNYIASTATYPNNVTTNNILYASATDVVSGLATANSGVLVTNGSGVPSISSTLPPVTVGAGQAVQAIYSASATLDFVSTASHSQTDLTITVTGAVADDPVFLSVPSGAYGVQGVFTAFVTAANTVTVRFHNYTASAKDPLSGAFRVVVMHF